MVFLGTNVEIVRFGFLCKFRSNGNRIDISKHDNIISISALYWTHLHCRRRGLGGGGLWGAAGIRQETTPKKYYVNGWMVFMLICGAQRRQTCTVKMQPKEATMSQSNGNYCGMQQTNAYKKVCLSFLLQWQLRTRQNWTKPGVLLGRMFGNSTNELYALFSYWCWEYNGTL